jgi:serine/alanine adding enzyme
MSKWKLSFYSTTGEDLIIWKNMIKRFLPENMDIHYTPEYAQIYEKTFGQDIFLAFFGDENDFIISPFVRHQINQLPFLQEDRTRLENFDIESIYGYGGPLPYISSNQPDLIKELFLSYIKDFSKFCSTNSIVDEYIRFHPLLKNYIPFQDILGKELLFVKPIVFLDLNQPEEVLWNGLCRGHRSSINKARRNGVTVEIKEPDEDSLRKFQEIYNETMSRNEAESIWRLPESYFQNCVKYLGKNNTLLFNALYKENVIASYFIIYGYKTVYYHFGGSQEAEFYLRANNLLIYEIALWAKSNGYRWFHLGGGIKPNDGVFQFKSGFSKNIAPLFSCNLIYNQQEYASLCSKKETWDLSHNAKSTRTFFFPRYRG